TITGSIGVIAQFPDLHQLMERFGVKVGTIRTGPFKDTGSPLRSMRKDEEELLQGLIGSSFEQFVRAVAEGRKLPLESVRRIADGRVLTGEQALAVKLVDRLGNLQDAVAEAGRLSGIGGKPHVVYSKKKKSLLVQLLADEAATRIRETMGGDGGGTLRYEMRLR
ncbi:MAG TPA: S49 family peptidase, partial [Verrucomicrobiae bacterium]|nr:S49 family peptidase [Verrucomicrobiae bacterium]